MGADLCGVILVGPKHIDEDAKKRAVERVTAGIKAQARLSSILANDRDPETELTKEELDLLGHVLEYSFMDDWLDLDDVQLLGEWDSPERFVQEFVSMWEHGHVCTSDQSFYRDCMMRPTVDPRTGEVDQDFQIFVAGERTWGDGPEIGSAWDLCQRAEWLGLMQIFGMR